MAINTVLNNAVTNLFRHAAMLCVVAFNASLREKPHVASLLLVWIMAIRTGHLRFLETLTPRQTIELITGMYAVLVEVRLAHLEMIGDTIAGPKSKRRRLSWGRSRVALPTDV